MLGAVIGDIIGSKYEWNNIKTKEFTLFDKVNCHYTDDTVMTLAVAKSLLECNGDYTNLQEIVISNMIKIGREHPKCGYGRSFYNWIFSDNHTPYNSYGNGSAMRTSTCGIVVNSIEEAISLSNTIASVSHNHPEGIKGAEATTVAIFLAKQKKSINEIKKYINDHYYKIDFSLDEIRDNYTFDVSCQGSVPQALEAFFESTSFEDTIRNAISIGGDSDTIAAIAGGIASVYYDVPKHIITTAKEYLSPDLLSIEEQFTKKYILKK